jgi:hypothetical protein
LLESIVQQAKTQQKYLKFTLIAPGDVPTILWFIKSHGHAFKSIRMTIVRAVNGGVRDPST